MLLGDELAEEYRGVEDKMRRGRGREEVKN
jgi:hypothetical protein